MVIGNLIFSQIDQAFAAETHASADQPCASIELACIDGEARFDGDIIAQCICDSACHKIAWVHFANQPEDTVIGRHTKRGDPVFLRTNEKPALPARPGSVSPQFGAIALRKTEHGNQGPVFERLDIGRKIEVVAVRFRIDEERERVPFTKTCIAVDEKPTILDLDLGIEINSLRRVPGDAGCQHKIVYFQLVDGNVETWQDRAVFLARNEFGKARQSRAMRGERIDIEPVIEPGPRVPVDLGLWNGQEYTLRIGQGNIVQHRIAIDIALDPSDPDNQTVRESPLAYLARQEPLTQRRVEHHQCGNQKQYRSSDEDDRPLPDPAPSPAFALGSRLFVHSHFGHQNACPSDT